MRNSLKCSVLDFYSFCNPVFSKSSIISYLMICQLQTLFSIHGGGGGGGGDDDDDDV